MNEPISPDRRREIAAALGINEQYLYQCLSGVREMAPEKAVELEALTKGQVTRFMVVTKRGHQIWPELVGSKSAPRKRKGRAAK